MLTTLKLNWPHVISACECPTNRNISRSSRRTYLAEVVATRAEVLLHDQTGWAIRMGTDRPTALGAAILDAICEVPTDEFVEYVELHRSIAELCAQTIDDQAEAKAAEWNEISKTIVNFEALE
ncbi:MAG: hypothetical protein EBV40_01025 [Actinobacteria bacterium]|nr:hypothetical protein [Actinomycetota bacterium]